MTRARAGRLCRAAPALLCAALLSASCGGTARPAVTPRPLSNPVATLRADIDRLIQEAKLERATWGVLVRATATGEVIYETNADKLLLPASSMKLVTLAAAAETLGWDYTFKTTVAGVGAIDFGFLDGDLVVIGSGDPSIDDWDGGATRLFQSWAERLKALGVRTVGGRLIGDDDDLEDQSLGAGWAWDDLAASFATSSGALQFNQNTARVMVTAGAAAGAPAAVALVPDGNGLDLSAHVTTADATVPALLQIRRRPGSRIVEATGLVPAGQTVYRNVAVQNPTTYFLDALYRVLVANGIEIRGGAVDIDELATRPDRADAVPLIVHQSPPLSVIAATMMKNSQNLYAETLLAALGGDPHTPGSATAEGGRVRARSLLDAWGIPGADMVVADGSGLSRYNLATARAFVTLLTHVSSSEALRAGFEPSLPVAGVDGTLGSRMRGTPAEGNARAKTGSFSNARALAGYVRSADGEQLAFALLANNFGNAAGQVEQLFDAIVVRLAEFSRN